MMTMVKQTKNIFILKDKINKQKTPQKILRRFFYFFLLAFDFAFC